MKIIKPYFIIEDPVSENAGAEMLKRIEKAGRTCYQSDDKIKFGTNEDFARAIIKLGHESVLEHEKITVRIVCDRGVSHELVRHRLASYSQESTRYCNYSKDKFGREITVIDPSDAFSWIKDGSKECSRLWCIWEDSMQQAEKNYFEMLEYGAKPQQARAVLPNSLKTEVVMTANVREWRWFFIKRTANDAHPQMIEIARPMLSTFRERFPILFDDVGNTDEQKKNGSDQ